MSSPDTLAAADRQPRIFADPRPGPRSDCFQPDSRSLTPETGVMPPEMSQLNPAPPGRAVRAGTNTRTAKRPGRTTSAPSASRRSPWPFGNTEARRKLRRSWRRTATAAIAALGLLSSLVADTANAGTPTATARTVSTGAASSEASLANRRATVKEAVNECPVKTNTAMAGQALSQPIALHPTPQSGEKLVNLDTNRAPVIVKHVTVTTNRKLPATVTEARLNFDATLSRTDNTLETAEFPDPTFSRPHISNDRRSISFAICLNPAGVSAGKYAGTVTISGPEGLGSAVILLTVNAKAFQALYWVAALLVAFLLVVVKDGARIKKEYDDKKTENVTWWKSVWRPVLTDPIWWATTLVSLGVVAGTLWKIYATDPSWGANGLGSLVALVGAAAAAVGGHAVISSLTPSVKAL